MLTINNKTIKITQDISLRLLSPLFNKQLSYSFPIKIANNVTNRTALNVQKDISGYRFTPSQNCTLTTQLFNKNFKLYINKIDYDIEIQLVETDFFYLFGAKKLQEITSKFYAIGNPQLTLNSPNNYDYVFCKIQNDELLNSFDSSFGFGTNPLREINHSFTENFRFNIPFFKILFVIEHLFNSAGYNVDITALKTIPDISKLYFFNNYSINSYGTEPILSAFVKPLITACYKIGDDVILEFENITYVSSNDYIYIAPEGYAIGEPYKITDSDVFPPELFNKKIRVQRLDNKRLKINDSNVTVGDITYARRKYPIQNIYIYNNDGRRYISIETGEPNGIWIDQTFKRIPWVSRKNIYINLSAIFQNSSTQEIIFVISSIYDVKVDEIYYFNIPKFNIIGDFTITSIKLFENDMQLGIAWNDTYYKIKAGTINGTISNNWYTDLTKATCGKLQGCKGMEALNNVEFKFIEEQPWMPDNIKAAFCYAEISPDLNLGDFNGLGDAYLDVYVLFRGSGQHLTQVYSLTNNIAYAYLKNHLPNITFKQFVDDVEGAFGCKFIPNSTGFKAVLWRDIITKPATKVLDNNAVLGPIDNKAYDVTYTMYKDGNDTMTQQLQDLPPGLRYYPDVNTYANLPNDAENLSCCYVKNENTNYVSTRNPLNEVFKWEKAGLKGFNNGTFANAITPTTETDLINIEPKVQPLLHDSKVRANIKITVPSLLTNNECNATRLFFYDSVSQSIKNETDKLSLRMQSAKPTLYKWAYDNYAFWLKNKYAPFNGNVKWSNLNLATLQWEDKVNVNGTDCFISQIDLTITADGIKVGKTYMVKA